MLFFYSTFTWKHWIGLLLTTAAYVIPYRQLASMAKPAYHDDGELLDGGFDMSTGGVCGTCTLSYLVEGYDTCAKCQRTSNGISSRLMKSMPEHQSIA
ncbi:hypothetical protein CK203_042695 [Vitis vinifera]|nr:hypothetical protein CK203_042695 [Vitis vinifera]